MTAKMTYAQQLAHPNWQRKRLETLQEAAFNCCSCGDAESTLHVHHKRYIKGRLAWEYAAEELAVLCESCHKAEHDRMNKFDISVMQMPLDGGPWSFQAFCGVAAGWSMQTVNSRENAIELAGGEGFSRSVDAGNLARELVWSGRRWPNQLLMDFASVVDDPQLVEDVTIAVEMAMKRSAAAWAKSGM